MKSVKSVLAVAVAVTALLFQGPASAAPVVYDLTTDWSDAVNPNGAWSYEVNGINATSGIRTNDPFTGPLPIWGSAHVGWSKSTGSELFPHDWASGTVFGHTPNSGNIAIAWTSAVNGPIDISGGIWEGRDVGRSNDWSLTKNGLVLTDGVIASGDIYDSSNPFDFLTGSGGSAAITGISANIGDVFRLVVGKTASSSFGDYVALNLTVSQSVEVVEPAAPILFGLGLAGLGYARRKRSR